MINYKRKLEKIYNGKMDKIQETQTFGNYIHYFDNSVSNDASIMYSKVGKGLQSNTNTK